MCHKLQKFIKKMNSNKNVNFTSSAETKEIDKKKLKIKK